LEGPYLVVNPKVIKVFRPPVDWKANLEELGINN
jgi:hypothetical protein